MQHFFRVFAVGRNCCEKPVTLRRQRTASGTGENLSEERLFPKPLSKDFYWLRVHLQNDIKETARFLSRTACCVIVLLFCAVYKFNAAFFVKFFVCSESPLYFCAGLCVH